MWGGFTLLKKAFDPDQLRGNDGKWIADGADSTVTVEHNGKTYAVTHGPSGKPILIKNVGEKGSHTVWKITSGKSTDAHGEILNKAKQKVIESKAPAAPKGPGPNAKVDVEANGVKYVVHHDADGKPSKLVGNYASGTHTLWNAKSGDPSPSKAAIIAQAGGTPANDTPAVTPEVESKTPTAPIQTSASSGYKKDFEHTAKITAVVKSPGNPEPYEVVRITKTVDPTLEVKFKDFNTISESARASLVYNAAQDHYDKNLTSSQRSAVNSYQQQGYSSINRALLGLDPLTPSVASKITAISKSIDKWSTPTDMTVYRGLGTTPDKVFNGPPPKPGDTFVHKNFASVSHAKGSAEGFSSGVLFEIKLPKGTPAHPMTNKIHSERELVLHHSSVMKVVKVEQMLKPYSTTETYTKVTMEYQGVLNR